VGRFSNSANAEGRSLRRYFPVGKYKVRVTEVEDYDADGLCVAVKAEILTSNNKDVEEGEIRQCSWPLSKKKHPGPQFFKEFVAACMGEDADDEKITPETWEKAMELFVSSKQPAAGKILDATVVGVMKDGAPLITKSGEQFTNVYWKLSE
jgi:hypothetical protein